MHRRPAVFARQSCPTSYRASRSCTGLNVNVISDDQRRADHAKGRKIGLELFDEVDLPVHAAGLRVDADQHIPNTPT